MNPALQWIMNNPRLRRGFTALSGPYVAIFTLHRPKPRDAFYSGISETLLERCLHYARDNGYEFASVDSVIRAALEGQTPDRPQLCITLDDGYRDQVERLVPLLLAYDAKPTLFAITDFADDKSWPWDAQVAYVVKHTDKASIELELDGERVSLALSDNHARIQARRHLVAYAKELDGERVRRFLAELERVCDMAIPATAPEGSRPACWPLLRDYEQKGLTIGSHSRSHNLFRALGDSHVEAELTASRRRLAEELDAPSRVFCYPSGRACDFSPWHERLVKEAGYDAALSSISKVAYHQDIRSNPYRVARIGFPDNLDQFARYVSWLEALRSKFPQ